MLMVDESNMIMKYWCYGTNRGKPKYLEKNLPSATSAQICPVLLQHKSAQCYFSTNPTWTCL